MKKFHALFIIIVILSSLAIAQTKTYIAVLDLQGKGLTEMEASILTDRLRNELFQTGKFRLLEREMMSEILKEQGFQLSECTSTSCMVEIGQLLNVEFIISGSVSKFGSMFSISSRMISVETGEIFSTATFDHEGKIEDLLIRGMKEVAFVLTGQKTQKDIIQSKQITDVAPQNTTQIHEQTTPTKTYNNTRVRPTYKLPKLLLKLDVGIFDLSNNQVTSIFDETTLAQSSLSISRTFINTGKFAISPIIGIQQASGTLIPKNDGSISIIQNNDIEYKVNYSMFRSGIQSRLMITKKITLGFAFGYSEVNVEWEVEVDGRDVEFDYDKSENGTFTELFISLALSKNLLLDFVSGGFIPKKNDEFEGSKIAVGLSLAF